SSPVRSTATCDHLRPSRLPRLAAPPLWSPLTRIPLAHAPLDSSTVCPLDSPRMPLPTGRNPSVPCHSTF
ncbi:Hypothetical protein SMAX5B_002595, partial [Scophthalmus maximus]